MTDRAQDTEAIRAAIDRLIAQDSFEAPYADAARASLDRLVARLEAAEQALRDPLRVARLFHDHYETLAPDFGYKTREASAVPWDAIPTDNARLMVATASEVLADLRAALAAAAPGETEQTP